MNNEIYFDGEDVNRNKALVIVSLLFGITFFLPLVACPGSSYGKFYANQGLWLFLLSGINTLLIKNIPLIGGLASTIIGLALFVCVILEIKGAAEGKAARVPVVGEIELIK